MKQFLLFAVATVVASSVYGTIAPQTDRILVVHRHGARGPLVNISNACGNTTCGQLSDSGKEMLFSLGKHLRSEYGDILPDWYDIENSFQTTADTQRRTIQSASALLKGMFFFRDNYTVYQAIDSTEVVDSPMDPHTAFHSYGLKQKQIYPGFQDYFISNYMSDGPGNFTNKSYNLMLAEEIGLSQEECEKSTYWWCSVDIWDFLTCYQSNHGDLAARYPLGAKALPVYDAMLQLRFQLSQFGYVQMTGDTAFYEKAGRPGSPLLDNIIGSMAAKENKPFIEWSGHDTTLMPLMVAMGNLSWTYPVFATAMIFEGFTNGSGGERWVRVKLGAPEQLPGTGFPYSFSWYPIQCMSKSGKAYTSLADGCPVEDFRRKMSLYSPTVSNFACYTTPDVLQFANCTSSDPAGKSDSLCAGFRAACPFDACGSGKFLAPDLSCQNTSGN